VFPAEEYHAPRESSGFFAGIETDLIGVHIKNRLVGTVTFSDGSTDTAHLTPAELDWTLSPRFNFGYRFSDDLGMAMVTYRFIATDGYAILSPFDQGGDGNLKSRLDVQVVDLDYVSHNHQFWSAFDMHWWAGVRLGSVFFDNRAIGQVADVEQSDYFFGAGPHLGGDLWWRLGAGFGLYGKLDTSFPIGDVRQRFRESFLDSTSGSVIEGLGSVRTTKAIPTLEMQAGVGWNPIGDRLRVLVGYQFEQWWLIGDVDQSRAQLTSQGVFFRGEFSF
jgi:hypothetical protein